MRTWCDISLDNLKYNIEQVKKKVSPKTMLCGIVKANAYGHGASEIARTLLDNGFNYLAVAFIDEAEDLRNSGITDAPILILGNTPKDTVAEVIEYNITAAVYNTETAEAISAEAVRRNKTAKIHIKIDTGMSRIGFLPTDESINKIAAIKKLPNLEIEGIFTHFANSDSSDESMTLMQFARFTDVIEKLEKRGIEIPIKHCCNSAAIIKFPHMHLDMVRAGIILYGMYPSDIDYDISLKPLMQLKTTVINVKQLNPGETISYGATYTVSEPTKVATIAVGYADGYPRLLSNKARVLVNGQFANILGRICMDQCMIDVTAVNNINVGDEVIIIGESEGKRITADDAASAIGTIGYELVCLVGKRVPRIYLRSGSVIDVTSGLV